MNTVDEDEEIPTNFQEEHQDYYDTIALKETSESHKLNTTLMNNIESFKTLLFKELIHNQDKRLPNELGAMYAFHSHFLSYLSYWIGLLDTEPVIKPTLQDDTNLSKLKELFEAITTEIKEMNSSSESRQLAYMTLFHFSTEHPFHLYKDSSKLK